MPPGEILVEHHLEPDNISISAFARKLGISRKHLSDIIHERARVTPATAVILARALNTTPNLWLNLQAAVDIWDAEKEFARSRSGKRKAA